MSIYRIDKKFIPNESFLISYDLEKHTLHVLDDNEAANVDSKNVINVAANSDEARGHLFKSIIHSYFSCRRYADACEFADQIVLMASKLCSLFEATAFMMQSSPSRMMSVGLENQDFPVELRNNLQECGYAMISLCVNSKHNKLLNEEAAKRAAMNLTLDDEMDKDFNSNAVSHPEYRLSESEVIELAKLLADPDHFAHAYAAGYANAKAYYTMK